MLLGNEKNQKFMENVETSRSHAFLLYGLEGIGKKTIAMETAKRLVGVSPDFYFIEPEGSSISIEQIRNFKNSFYLTSVSGYKTAVIDNAHLLTTEASNSLLKILEEPPGNAYIFLITDQYNKILPTIRSRCLALRFNPLKKEMVCDFLLKSGFDKKVSEQASLLANGSAGRALNIAQNFKEYFKNYENFQKLIRAPWIDRINFSKELSAADNLAETIDNWIAFSRFIEDSPQLNAKALDRLLKLRYIISHPQYNARLALENFLLSL